LHLGIRRLLDWKNEVRRPVICCPGVKTAGRTDKRTTHHKNLLKRGEERTKRRPQK